MGTIITETVQTWTKNPNTKTTYILVESETRQVDVRQVYNATSKQTQQFFRRLGGTERVYECHTPLGMMPYKCTSISPDRQTKKVRLYTYEYQTSESALIEWAEANDIEFLENGEAYYA